MKPRKAHPLTQQPDGGVVEEQSMFSNVQIVCLHVGRTPESEVARFSSNHVQSHLSLALRSKRNLADGSRPLLFSRLSLPTCLSRWCCFPCTLLPSLLLGHHRRLLLS